MTTISDLRKIEEVFLSKLPGGSEITLEGQHDVIFFCCYKHSEMNEEDFLTEEEISAIQECEPGFHYSNEAGSWAAFT